MKRRPHTPIKVEKINMSAEQIRYLLSRIETKIGKDEFPNYRVPFNELTPEQKESLRGPQGNSGILGDINNISLEIVNDLNGGESTSKTLRALSAEQGKVLHQLVKNNKTTLEQQIKNVFAQLPIINISQRTGRYGISLEDAVSYIQLEWVESYGGGIIILFMDEKDMWNAYMYNYDSDAGGYDDVTNYKKLSWDYDEIIALKTIINSIDINVGHNTEDIVRLNGRIDALGSVYSAQGSKNSLTELLAVTSAKKGYVYSIESEFYLNGKYYAAGTNVVCITEFSSASENKSSNWDALGGTFNASLYLEKEKAAIANKSDITSGIDRKEDITYTERGKQYISGGALGSVLPFKLISKTTLDNGDIAWYRLAFNYPTGSSNGAQQLLLQYAETTTIPTEADWKTINYINDINLSSLLSRSDVANNLTTTASGKMLDARQGKVLADAIASKQDILVSGANIKTINNQSILGEGNITIEGGSGVADVGITGTLNLTDLNSIAAAQDLITKPYGVAFYLITDSNGRLPSKNQEAVEISASVERLLSFRSPNPTVNNILDQVSMDNFKPRGVNVGDIIALSRVPVGIDTLVEYLGLSSAIATALKLLGLSKIEIYQYKIWATNDAKWSNFQNKDGSVVAPGVKGLMSVWDKEQVDKVPRLEANDLSTKYPYGTQFDYCLDTGVCAYSPATIGGITENFTLVVQRSSTVDSGGFYTIIQSAYGRTGEVYNRIFQRMIFHNPSNGTIERHDWVEISTSAYVDNAIYSVLNTEV